MQKRATLGWLLLFLPLTTLFYWKILLTRQFSLLTDREAINQAYSWLQFTITSIRHGRLPLWDPYAISGRSFPGEMQTAAFYPLHYLLALVPFNHASVLSPVTYHVWFAVTHLLGAIFMFSLIREFGLSRISAFIGGICFSFGGYLAHISWPHLLESGIWTPLVFLFFLRALRAASSRLATLNACIGGLMFGMSVLAGGLHIVLLELVLIGSAGIYYACSSRPDGESRPSLNLPSANFRAAIAVAVLGVVGMAAGAVQLFPSFEYSSRALRFLGAKGAIPANQPIPYDAMDDEFLPQGIALMVAPFAFNGNATVGEATSPYIGVFPLLAAIIGIRRYWQNRWVRYLAGLAVAAFLFSMGSFSWLHGVMYATVPKLWAMREASRIVFLMDFALSILAAYGVEALVFRNRGQESEKAGWPGLNRTLLGIVIACGAALFVPGMFGKPDTNPWNALSIVMIFASYGLFQYMEHGNRGRAVQAIMIGLILFDLSSRDWTAINRLELTRDRVDQLDRILSARPAAQFLNAQPGVFRIQIQGEPIPNIGDLYGVPMIHPGGGATLPIDYTRMMGYTDLLNVRYVLTSAKEQKPGAVYQDKDWKVYENPNGYPRAWTVHETSVEPSAERAAEQLGKPGFDAHLTALTEAPLALEPRAGVGPESVKVSLISPTRMELEVDAESRGLVVLSENYYPGWRAVIDGQNAPIYRVDGGLRGVVVPRGHCTVILSYAPGSIYWGGLLTLLTFGGTLVALWFRRRSAKQ